MLEYIYSGMDAYWLTYANSSRQMHGLKINNIILNNKKFWAYVYVNGIILFFHLKNADLIGYIFTIHFKRESNFTF